MSSKHVPSYRRKRSKSGDYGIVSLPDGTGGRADVLLGRYGTPESRAEYARVIAEWEVNGRRMATAVSADITVNELALLYWRECEKRKIRDLAGVRSALRPLKELYGHTVAAKFSPLGLKAVREKMIATTTRSGRPWSRGHVNACVARIKSMFRWGVEEELIPAVALHAIAAVRGLQRGRTAARETEDVKPVALHVVEATIAHAPTPVAAMIRLQLLTGARPGEIVIMRACDLNTSGRVWFFTPEHHKNNWRGHSRLIAIGPRAQEVLKPFLTTTLDAYLFSPAQSMEEWRQTLRLHRKTKVQPSQQNRKREKPRKQPRDRYDVDTYRQAIHAAAAKADAEAHRERPDVPAEERIVPHWSPNQLRHTAATELRKQFGLDGARAILGHRSTRVTEVYAEVDAAAATRIMSEVG